MISQSRYIKIVSGVGAGAAVAQRQLILRLITQNAVLPPGIVMEAANADAVGAYFGMNSEEYKRAQKYFSFISKNIKSPSLISFARWVNAPIAPMIIGDALAKSLAALKTLVAGTMTVNVTAANVTTPVAIAGVDLSAATTLTNVAALIQTALRASANAQLTTCTVTFNTNTNQFTLTGTVTGSGSITVTPTGLATDISPLLGWGTTGTVYVDGQAASTAAEAVAKSAAISNNMGSFAFCTTSVAMSNSDIDAVSDWNASQNNMYLYTVATTIGNMAALFALVKGNSGTAISILSTTLANDYVEQCPSEIMAATDYNSINAVQNYMFYPFANRNVTVSDDATADACDANRANYIGATQSAGQPLSFYQRGMLCGGATDATDMNTYANEAWLKSDITTRLLSYFLSIPNVPANQTGQAALLGQLQVSIDLGKSNGTISPGKTLTETQKQELREHQ